MIYYVYNENHKKVGSYPTTIQRTKIYPINGFNKPIYEVMNLAERAKKSLCDMVLKTQYIDFISKKVNFIYLKIMKITVNLSKSIRTPIQITTHFQISHTGGSAL